MEITSVTVSIPEKYHPYDREHKCKGFAHLCFDEQFVIHDIKIIEANDGTLFICMPDRKVMDTCPYRYCHTRNHVRARFCNTCGHKLEEDRVRYKDDGRPDLYFDVAHPISQEYRKYMEEKVIAEYHAEVERLQEKEMQEQLEERHGDDVCTAGRDSLEN